MLLMLLFFFGGIAIRCVCWRVCSLARIRLPRLQCRSAVGKRRCVRLVEVSVYEPLFSGGSSYGRTH